MTLHPMQTNIFIVVHLEKHVRLKDLKILKNQNSTGAFSSQFLIIIYFIDVFFFVVLRSIF